MVIKCCDQVLWSSSVVEFGGRVRWSSSVVEFGGGRDGRAR
ncbi:hypothetical protein [Streptomyces sp. NPDC048845]